jgi:hypothetical protein
MILPSFRTLLIVSTLCAAAVVPATAQTQQPARTQRPQAATERQGGAAATRPAQAPQPTQARPGAASNPQRPSTAARPAAAPAAVPGGASATQVASFGDWGVYTAQSGRAKICYALTQPKDRLPKNLNRDPAYLFVSFRPAENVRNEVALVMGFATKEDSPAQATIGTSSYALLTKEENAWLKNPAEEGQAISTMSKAQSLQVKVLSRRGNQLTDRYSLNGFSAALERARKECS